MRGGGERVALTLAKALRAELLCGYRTFESYEHEMFPPGTVELGLPDWLRRPGRRPPALALRFAMARRYAQQFQTRIFSGVAAPFAAPAGGGRNIFYCHTPPRFLYDQREHFTGRHGLIGRLALGVFEAGYRRAIGRMHTIIANSETVRERIHRFLGRDSVVIHPPCRTQDFRWIEQGDYYLSTARLSKLKRVDAIVDAFLRMPAKRLVIASSGEEAAALKARAAGASNISFLGWTGEQQLQELVGRAIATIYVPVDEDFGMSPVESMAAGKPVIGVAEGGMRETVVHGETGLLLEPPLTPHDIIDAVSSLTPQRALQMRRACEQRAELFSEARFIAAMSAILEAQR